MSRFFSHRAPSLVPPFAKGGQGGFAPCRHTGWGWGLLPLLALLLLASVALAELAPAPLDLTIVSGETYTLQRRLRAGTRIADLTGYSYRAQLRASYSDTAPLAEFAAQPGDTSGIVKLTLSALQTTALNMKTGYWDLLLIAPDGTQSYILRGKFKCVPSATR